MTLLSGLPQRFVGVYGPCRRQKTQGSRAYLAINLSIFSHPVKSILASTSAVTENKPLAKLPPPTRSNINFRVSIMVDKPL